jgi:hypothetical protein
MYTKSNFICFYGTEICSLAVREGHTLRVYEKRVLTRILCWSFEKDAAVVSCVMRSFIICALHQTLSNEIKKLKWPVHASHIGDRRNTHSMLIGKPSGRPKCRWEDDIKMDLKETGYEGVNCINLA